MTSSCREGKTSLNSYFALTFFYRLLLSAMTTTKWLKMDGENWVDSPVIVVTTLWNYFFNIISQKREIQSPGRRRGNDPDLYTFFFKTNRNWGRHDFLSFPTFYFLWENQELLSKLTLLLGFQRKTSKSRRRPTVCRSSLRCQQRSLILWLFLMWWGQFSQFKLCLTEWQPSYDT